MKISGRITAAVLIFPAVLKAPVRNAMNDLSWVLKDTGEVFLSY